MSQPKIFSALDRLESAARKHNMIVSRIESDEDGPTQRWMAWVKRNEPGSLAIGTYGAMGLSVIEAMENLAFMLEGMEVRNG
jgi:hypothetical protein